MSFDPTNIPGWDPVNGGFGVPADSVPNPVASAAPPPPPPPPPDPAEERRRLESVSRFEGPTTLGLRGEYGGENARWGVNPRTGMEEPVFEGYLLSDLLNEYGDIGGIRSVGRLPGYGGAGSLGNNPANPDSYDPYYGAGMFDQALDLFGQRPSNDTFSGKDGLADIISIISMAMPVITGAVGAAGAAGGAGSTAATGASADAALAGGGEVGSGYAASAQAPGMFSNVPGWAMNAGTTLGLQALGGATPTQAARAALISGGIGAGADAATPYVNDVIDEFQNGVPQGDDSMRRMMVADSGTGMFDMAPPLMPPAIQPEVAFNMMPAAQAAVDPTFGGALTETAPGMFSQAAASTIMPPAAPEAGDPTATPPLEAPPPAGTPVQHTISPEQLQRYVKLGMQVANILGGEADGPKAPAADATPEEQAQYAQDIVKYLGLDAQTMADAGLTPGSPEYMAYILDQADAIIAQVLGDLDVDSADLAAQLRTKTDKELQTLQRALFVRGQLGQKMGAGTYKDPFTGTPEEVIGAGMFDPNTAAFQRGIASNVDTLAGLRGNQAYSYLQDMLGRNADVFGMQEAADQRFEQAKLDDETRRRGMLSY